jgi:hypothetical protein
MIDVWVCLDFVMCFFGRLFQSVLMLMLMLMLMLVSIEFEAFRIRCIISLLRLLLFLRLLYNLPTKYLVSLSSLRC